MLTWDAEHHTYRDDDGDLLTTVDLVAIRDELAARGETETAALADRLLSGAIDRETWERGLQRLIVTLMTSGYVFGRGGIARMDDEDYDALSAEIERQSAYIQRFRTDLDLDSVSDAQLVSRSALYAGVAVMMYELGRSRAHGIQYPAYPGDTPCLTRCRCRWDTVDKGDTWECTWVLSGGDSCTGCRDNANRWASLIISKATGDIVPDMPV